MAGDPLELDAARLLEPQLVEINRLAARAPLAGYDTAEAARAGDDAPWRLSLDGLWNFRLIESPDRLPPHWPERAATMARSWNPVEVPGCWTRQRVGDWPHYTNIVMPWRGLEAPDTPSRNPTGLYHRSFELPDGWLDRTVVLHLGGFESLAAVWCNGEFVGMGKDSRLPSEFDLGPSLRPGRNDLDIMVVRYSDASWIEDQDHWWHAGLHRSVFVEARARDRIDDIATTADFDPETGEGRLHVDAHVCGRAGSAVRVTVYDGDRALASVAGEVPAVPDGSELDEVLAAYSFPGRVTSLDLECGPVDPWSAESPHRCRVVVELLGPGERCIQATSLDVGFRRIEVRDRRFLVNGAPIVLLGVNRHDHHPVTGKVLTVEELRDELLSMKRHNINAVRCAHYPNDHRLLDLCDELGMYVVDEANIECHARLRSLADDTRYLPAFLDRVKRMVLRDRNHPSVIMWSLGNESGHGAAHDACAAWVRAVEASRPVHYEGAIQERFPVGSVDVERMCAAPDPRERLVTDVVCPMYAAADAVVAWAQWAESTGQDDRPLVLCEYSHAMGNSNGSVADYVQAFHDEPALAGGFVWDWRDQGLYEVDDRGREYWAYGGHFADHPNDANFCINGLVGPDGEPHPGLTEVMWAYRPVALDPVRGRRVRLRNRRAFTSTEDLEACWSLVIDGAVVESGTLDVVIDAADSVVLSVPYETTIGRGQDARLRMEWRQTAETPWAATGHVVAWDELELRSNEPVTPAGPLLDDAVALSGAGSVRAGDTELRWSDDGYVALTVDGVEAGIASLSPDLWRAPTDNDGVRHGWTSGFAGVRPRWIEWGLNLLFVALDGISRAETTDGFTAITIERHLVGDGAEATSTSTFVVRPDGVDLFEALEVPDEWTDVPRVGTRFQVDPRFDRLAWCGLGPHETYPDRKSSGLTGTWESRVADQYHPFVVPQEHGAHADTRWFTLTDRLGRGVRIDAATPVSFSARFEHDATLGAASTIADVEPSDTIEVHVDAAVRGLGTGACGPDTLPQYRVGPGTYHWAVSFSAVRPDES